MALTSTPTVPSSTLVASKSLSQPLQTMSRLYNLFMTSIITPTTSTCTSTLTPLKAFSHLPKDSHLYSTSPALFISTLTADPDPHVCGPPGSGFISLSYRSGSGSRSFNHWAKIVRKNLISTVLWLHFDFLPLKNDVKVPSKSNMQKTFLKFVFWWHLEGQWLK